MSKKTAKWLVGIGIAGCLFGLYALTQVDRVPDDLPPLAVPVVTVILLAIGLGQLRGALTGILVFVVGEGLFGLAVWRIKVAEDQMMVDIHREIEINNAAEAVCNGTPNTAALPAKGKRKMLQASKWPDMTGYGVGTWEGFPAPSSLAELQLVVCRVGTKSMTDSCSYDNQNGGTYTIYIYQNTEILTVRDAKTAAILGEKTFEGEKPSGKCDSSVKVPKYETSRDSSGMSPDRGAEEQWVKQFVSPAEN